jgi:hypothetical protein
MDGCDFAPGMDRGEYCEGYDEYALDYVDAVQPDVVLTTSTRTSPDSADEEMLEGMADAAEILTARGIDVLSIRDNPRWEENAYECAEAVIGEDGTPEEADEACGADASEKYAPEDPAADLVAAEGGGSLTSLDFSEQICPEGRCAPVLGDTYVYHRRRPPHQAVRPAGHHPGHDRGARGRRRAAEHPPARLTLRPPAPAGAIRAPLPAPRRPRLRTSLPAPRPPGPDGSMTV